MNHPYESVPDYARWRRACTFEVLSDVDPVVAFPLKITARDKVATAGSCFAQHISRYLKQSGFSVMVTEPAHPMLNDADASAFNYGIYTARYGNIYTSRQLLQLFQRALGRFEPIEPYWTNGERFIDPLRPTIQPDGFASLREYELDRSQHMAAVRRAMQDLDILVFTFGLTEVWINRADGTAYPLCPGVCGGTFDPQQHVFVNLTAADVVADMTAAIALLREVNPAARVILTVSPVPLIATAENRHVQVSTTYSKSVLRVAAEELTKSLPNVHYFPSYEVITGNFARGCYFADDLRSVREEGVRHVMSLFFKHATDGSVVFAQTAPPTQSAETLNMRFMQRMEEVVEVLCDEDQLDELPRSAQQNGPSAVPTAGDFQAPV